MTLTEQVAQLRELARLSSGTRMLDVLIINILDELAQAVGRLEGNEPQGQTRSRQRSGDAHPRLLTRNRKDQRPMTGRRPGWRINKAHRWWG